MLVPFKTGLFIEYRTGLINVCPAGRKMTLEQRKDFVEFNKEKKTLIQVAEKLRNKFGKDLTFSIGGQTSIDCFPHGWDKTYCLQFLVGDYSDIHFFGDKCYKGGNDFEIFLDKRTKGNWIKNGPLQTIQLLEKLFEQY